MSAALSDRLSRPEPRRSTRLAALTVGTLSVLLICAVDAVTGQDFSFAILYLLPVMVVAAIVTTTEGYALSVLASVTWGVTSGFAGESQSGLALGWNIVGRLLTMSLLVFLVGSLRKMVVRLSVSERRSREFLSTAAHQLRTPIAGLVASAEALLYEPDDAARGRLVDNIVEGTDRSRRLLSSLLELSRLDQHREIDRRAFDLAELCRRQAEAADILRPTVTVRYDGPDTEIVESNADAIREALSNLVDNAVRHARSEVVVRLTPTDDGVRLDVSDDGAGLPSGQERLAFERFVSLDGQGGSGLGLPIAAASIESLAGDLSYRQGAFTIEVPLH